MKKTFKPFYKLYYFAKDRIQRSIRLELVVTFCICLLCAFIAGSWYNGRYNEKNVFPEIDYSKSINLMGDNINSAKQKLEKLDSKDAGKITNILDTYKDKCSNNTVKLYLCDLYGNVEYKSSNADSASFNIYSIIKKVEQFKREYDNASVVDVDNGTLKKRIAFKNNIEYVSIDGLNISNEKYYIVLRGFPKEKLTYVRPHGTPTSVLIAIVIFVGFFYFLTSKKMWYIEKISQGLSQISKNNLNHKIKIEGKDELAVLAGNINFMAHELKKKIKKEREAEKTKNDLITNVSHDLRTPLTSIKGYLNLLKDNKYHNEEELNSYINIAYTKSEKLEVLINDLFEYTKLSNNVIKLNKKNICLNELLEQLSEELYVICEDNNVEIITEESSKNVYADVDGDKIARVFENLLMNAVRYCPKPGKIFLKISLKENNILISVKNRCDNIKDEDLKKLFGRFYRMDKSRSEASGGSGLGLAISKSIVEMHGGSIWAESRDNFIIFFVKLKK